MPNFDIKFLRGSELYILSERVSLKKNFQKKIDRDVLQENKIQFQKRNLLKTF